MPLSSDQKVIKFEALGRDRMIASLWRARTLRMGRFGTSLMRLGDTR